MSAFDTADMQSALPTDGKRAPAAAVNSDGTKWAEPLPYNYDELAQQGPEVVTEWAGNGAVYEWDEEFGDVGPKFPDLELALFGDSNSRIASNSGLDFSV